MLRELARYLVTVLIINIIFVDTYNTVRVLYICRLKQDGRQISRTQISPQEDTKGSSLPDLLTEDADRLTQDPWDWNNLDQLLAHWLAVTHIYYDAKEKQRRDAVYFIYLLVLCSVCNREVAAARANDPGYGLWIPYLQPILVRQLLITVKI